MNITHNRRECNEIKREKRREKRRSDTEVALPQMQEAKQQQRYGASRQNSNGFHPIGRSRRQAERGSDFMTDTGGPKMTGTKVARCHNSTAAAIRSSLDIFFRKSRPTTHRERKRKRRTGNISIRLFNNIIATETIAPRPNDTKKRVSSLHRAATTSRPCCGQALGDSEGACRVALTRLQK